MRALTRRRALLLAIVVVLVVIMGVLLKLAVAEFARDAETAKGRTLSNITLTEADKGKTVEVSQGAEVMIRLKENPSTGYLWAFDQTDDTVLSPQSSTFSSTPGAAAGAGGTRIFTFTTGQPGTVHLRLKLWREWQGDSSIVERYDVNIQVHG